MSQRPFCFYYTHRPPFCQDGETGVFAVQSRTAQHHLIIRHTLCFVKLCRLQVQAAFYTLRPCGLLYQVHHRIILHLPIVEFADGIEEAVNMEESYTPRNAQGAVLSIRMVSTKSIEELKGIFTPAALSLLYQVHYRIILHLPIVEFADGIDLGVPGDGLGVLALDAGDLDNGLAGELSGQRGR
mgnify:CR=1 FL=1